MHAQVRLSTVHCRLFSLSCAWTSNTESAEAIWGYDIMVILYIDIIPLILLYNVASGAT